MSTVASSRSGPGSSSPISGGAVSAGEQVGELTLVEDC